MDVRGWNAMIWENIGVMFFLFIVSVLYFVGLFGKDQLRVGGKACRGMFHDHGGEDVGECVQGFLTVMSRLFC